MIQEHKFVGIFRALDNEVILDILVRYIHIHMLNSISMSIARKLLTFVLIPFCLEKVSYDAEHSARVQVAYTQFFSQFCSPSRIYSANLTI